MWCWESSRAVMEGRRNPKTRTEEDRNIFDVWSILISRILDERSRFIPMESLHLLGVLDEIHREK